MAIINASQQVELYDERLGRESYLNSGIHTAPSARCVGRAAGAALKNIQSGVLGYLKQGKQVALLGGEHTVSLAAVRAHRKMAPDLTVLCLDAHADLRDKYKGSPLNHACVSRRLLETGPLVIAGVRNISAQGASLAKERKLPLFFAHRGRLDSQAVSARILGAIKTQDVYLSLDLDVMDQALISV
jgi:agmatinase